LIERQTPYESETMETLDDVFGIVGTREIGVQQRLQAAAGDYREILQRDHALEPGDIQAVANAVVLLGITREQFKEDINTVRKLRALESQINALRPETDAVTKVLRDAEQAYVAARDRQHLRSMDIANKAIAEATTNADDVHAKSLRLVEEIRKLRGSTSRVFNERHQWPEVEPSAKLLSRFAVLLGLVPNMSLLTGE
jgi:hypothetical protein